MDSVDTESIDAESADVDGLGIEGAEPLEIPQRALEVDLAQAFSQLLFRASLLKRRRDEDAQAAKAAQRDLLGLLVEVDDALTALGLDRESVQLGRGEGIEATRRRLLGKLAKAGVRRMRLEGMTADPALAEIVGTEPRADLDPETVVETVVTGFFWNDEVLRRAQVIVSTTPAEAPAEEPEPDTAEPDSAEADTAGPDTAEADAVLTEHDEPEVPVDPPAPPPARARVAGRTRPGNGGNRSKRRKRRKR